MAASYWAKTGWRKQLLEDTGFKQAGAVQLNATEPAGETAIVLDGGTDTGDGADIRNDISAGDVLYCHDKSGGGNALGWFQPKLMGRVKSVDSATTLTMQDEGLARNADDDDFVYILQDNSGVLATPIRTTELYLDAADDGSTYFYSEKFDWHVKEDFTLVLNYGYGNKEGLTLATDSNLNNVEVVGSINGLNWAVLEDFESCLIDGVVCAKVFDIDAKGVMPYMAIRTTGTTTAQTTHSDSGGILKINVAVVPHG